MTIQKQLQEQLAADFKSNHGRLAAVARPLDPERLLRPPAPGRWSVGQVLEHLALLDGLFLSATEPLLRAARPDAAAPLREWKPSFVGGRIAGALAKPKPLKALRVGSPGTPRNGVTEAYLALDLRYQQLLEETAALDWNAVRLRPPVLPWLPLKINLGDVFQIHRVHVRRHLQQIERTIAAL